MNNAPNMKIVNLTPHEIAIQLHDKRVMRIAASGQLARLAVSREKVDEIGVYPADMENGGIIEIIRPTLGEIEGLPETVENTIYLVSALVAEKARRNDVMSPGELVRDETGKVIACKGLCSYSI
jgi:hypothetical protein